MDESKKIILEKRIEKTMKALEKNKMKPFYAEIRQQAGKKKKSQKRRT